MRFASSAVFALTIALVLGGVAHGQPPAYELRTMVLNPATSTDLTQQFGMSKLRAPYLCSHCGYSSMTPGNCPNPFGVAGHPVTALVLAERPHDRVLDVARAVGDGAPPTADIRYRDTAVPAGAETYNTPNRFLSVIGRPFLPTRESDTPGGSSVYGQFAWPNRPAGWDEARAQFVTLPPGVKEPHAYVEHQFPSDADKLVGSVATRYGNATTGNIPVWNGDPLQWYAQGATVSIAGETDWFYWCREGHLANAATNRPGSGTDWRRYWYRYDLRYYAAARYRIADTWVAGTAYPVDYQVTHDDERNYRAYVCVQNHNAADANRPGTGANWMDYWEHRDLCDIRLNRHRAADGDKQYIRYYSYHDGTNFRWRLLVYSRLYGLEFDSGRQDGEPPSGTGLRLVTAGGAVILELGVKPDPVAPVPGPDQAAAWQIEYDTHSNAFTSPPPSGNDSIAAPNVTGSTDIDAGTIVGWEGEGEYYAFAGGVDVVDNLDPYAVKPGEVGVGRVQLRWRSEADLPDDPTYDAGAGTYYYPGTEWWYDPGVGPLNLALASLTDSFVEEYRPIESRFMVSRYQVPPTGDSDRHGAVEANAGIGGDSGYARVVAGRPVADAGGDRLARAGETATRRDGLRVHNWLTQGDEYYRCPVCGATFTEPQDRGEGWPDGEYPEDSGWGVCPYHGDHSRNPDGSGPETGKPEYYAPGPRIGLERTVPTGRRVYDRLLRALTTAEVGDGGPRWLEAFPTLRPQIPDESVQITRQGQYVPLGSDGYGGVERAVAVRVPAYQPASEPGQEPGNALERNWGYRGMGVTFHDTIANVTEFELSDDSGWLPWATNTNYLVGAEVSYGGRGYRCTRAHRSNPGRRPDRQGGLRLWVLAGEWRTTTVVEENARWDVYLECPDCGMPHEQSPAALAPGDVVQCSNPHCPGHEWCPVCGSVYMLGMTTCPFDGAELEPLQPADVGHRNLAAEEYAAYDLEVAVLKNTELVAQAEPADGGRVAPGIDPGDPDRTVAAAGGTPPGRRADPSDVAHVGRTTVRNEGNTIPIISGIDGALYRLFRPEASQLGRGYGWAGTRNPVAGGLIHEYHGDTGLPLWGGEWKLASPPAGAAAGTSAGALAQVGGAGDGVGTGQVLGRYSSPLVYYLDTNDNDVFDFRTLGGQPLNSVVAVFDPERHVALEPYVLSHARVRVSEAPFPFNSYLARDVAPTPRFDYNNFGDPVRLQVMWMSNRVANPDVAPDTDAAVNLLYQTAGAAGVGEMRTYAWDTDALPLPLTADTGALAQNGPVDVYADGVGAGANLYALWHSTHRGAGGLTAALRTDQAPAANPVWTGSAPDEYLWAGRERAEGVRGLFDPDVAGGGARPLHWAFWHTGQRGQERIVYAAWQPDPSAPGGKRIYAVNRPVGVETPDAQRFIYGELPIANAIAPTDPADTVETRRDSDGIGPQAEEDYTLRKYPRGPFTAVKDVSPMLYLPPVVYDAARGGTETRPQIRVFFAGHARHLQNFDIYEVRFDREDFLDVYAGDRPRDPDTERRARNRGKVEFPYIRSMVSHGSPEGLPPMNPTVVEADEPGPGVYPGEELTPDARRQDFHSRHLDWLTGSGFLNNGSGVTLTLGVKLQGVPRHIHYYDVEWGPADYTRGEGYDRTRGVYVVIPRFRRHDDDVEFDPLPLWPGGPAVPAPAPNADWAELIEPETFRLPDREKRPIKMEIDPMLGRVRFSAPLFNSYNPADESTVFNSVFNELRNADGSSKVVDVFLCGDYTPFIWRHTMSPANDDNPTAMMMRGPWPGNQQAGAYPWALHSHNQGLMLFWRRTYGSGQAPYYGRTSYMMKHESGTVRTNHAPITLLRSVETPGDAIPQRELQGPGMPVEVIDLIEDDDFPNLPVRAEFDVDYANGEVAVWKGTYRWVEYPNGDVRRSGVNTVRVIYDYQYVDEDGNRQTATANEVHTVGGWSEETVLPIDTVLSEGPLRVAEETFRTPALPDGDTPFVVGRRYWVFWTSPRPVYDLRLPGDGGSVVRQASNVYYCAVTPEHPTLLRHRRASSNAPDLYRPPF